MKKVLLVLAVVGIFVHPFSMGWQRHFTYTNVEKEGGIKIAIDIPENVKSFWENLLEKYNGSFPKKWEIDISKDLENDIIDFAKQKVKGELKLLDIIKIENGYDILLRNETTYFEILYTETTKEIMKPKIEQVNSYEAEKVVKNYDAKNEEETSVIIYEEGTIIKKLTLTVSSRTYEWVTAWYSIYGKNIFGIVLWKVTAKGDFLCYFDTWVIDIIDRSSAYACWWLGWKVKDFDSWISWHPLLIWGQVDAEAQFDGPFQNPFAWAWVRVYGDGSWIGDGGYID